MPQQKNLLRLTSVKRQQLNEKQRKNRTENVVNRQQRAENQQLLIRGLHLKELWQRNVDLQEPVKQANQYRHL